MLWFELISHPYNDFAHVRRKATDHRDQRVQVDRDTLRVYLEHAAQAIPSVVNRLQQAGLNPISLTLTQPTLDDVFLQVTGQSLQTEQTRPAEAGAAPQGKSRRRGR